MGIQFQQPWFLAALAVVTTLLAASLFEWLPIGMPASVGQLASGRSGSSVPAAFLDGVLPTLLATPCSAPLVDTAEFRAAAVVLALPATLILLRHAAMRRPRTGAASHLATIVTAAAAVLVGR